MTHLRKKTLLLATLGLALTTTFGARAQTSPYAGEQQRAIKALDMREVAALRQGQGLGYAKAAELNGYPGPMHTLELAEPLQLSTEQRAATQRLMAEHKARARELGEAVVQAEAELDKLFAERQATPANVREATQRVASLQAQLRAEHLNTHLAQTALMSPAQALRYTDLRGYAAHTPAAPAEPGGRGSDRKHRH
ncbi:MAG: periplasmic heavy metal sensor [Chitinophagaceae bacterium]|nr:periplasmic heavy metal sensor [Rubrivivax sp.]